jgi:hypothetical protein
VGRDLPIAGAVEMTALSRRLHRLEARFVPPDDPEGRRLVALLQARIRRWAETNGGTYTPPPPEEFTGRLVVEILRERFIHGSAWVGSQVDGGMLRRTRCGAASGPASA